ncbi:MAG TPA: hypothetical protein VMI55_02120 [Thermoplasmata archaeon]|nr:hypothetical protein [Thermoplasmata archaeon]
MRPSATAVLVLLCALATLALLVGTTFGGFAFLIVVIFLLTVGVGWGVREVAPSAPWLLPTLLVLGVAISVTSILTGLLNGLSDEPYTTPAYAALGWGLYTHPATVTYVQYGTTHVDYSYYVYLPLLTFIQVPGLDYRWLSLAAWGAGVYLLRRDPFAAGGFSAPWIPLLAANGQNDFVPLLLLTVALAVRPPRGRWAAEVVGLALKQTANVVIFAYHLARREYLRALAAVAVTAAILAPFLWIDAGAVYCHVVVGSSVNTCAARPWTFFVFKRNYWLYPSWVVVVFHRPLGQGLERLRARLSSLGSSRGSPP